MLIDTIMFDYGGVVADHYCAPYLNELAKQLGTSRKKTRDLLSEKTTHGKEYRLDKITKSEFWDRVRELAPNKNFNDDVVQELWAKTYIPNNAMLELLSYLKNVRGIQTGIVMNEDRWRYRYVIENYPINECIDLIVPSFEVKVLKPESAMYLVVLEKCRRIHSPSNVLYIDDRDTHVIAAVNCGMKGYVYTNAGDINNYLESLFDL